jgi:hypothetical protein
VFTTDRLDAVQVIVGSLGDAELSASRARIVATADQTRRRNERDLLDGAQQRLVSLPRASPSMPRGSRAGQALGDTLQVASPAGAGTMLPAHAPRRTLVFARGPGHGPVTGDDQQQLGSVRTENLVRGCDQQDCPLAVRS